MTVRHSVYRVQLWFVRIALAVAFPFFFVAAVVSESFWRGYNEARYQWLDFVRIWKDAPTKLQERNARDHAQS